MKIFIDDLQDKVEFSQSIQKIVEKSIKQSIKHEDFKEKCQVSVSVVDNEQIQNINKEYRKIDEQTDVLSFPMIDFNVESDHQFDYDRGYLMLGDIVISLEKAQEQANEYGHSLEREVGFLCVHSVLHLLGYDHQNKDDTKIMREKEENILEELKLFR